MRVNILLMRVNILLMRVNILLMRVNILLMRVNILLMRVNILLMSVNILLMRVNILLMRVNILLMRVNILLMSVNILLMRVNILLMRAKCFGPAWIKQQNINIAYYNMFYSFKENPDMNNPEYNTKYGIYKPNCGLENVVISWGHDEYLYQVMIRNNSTIPEEVIIGRQRWTEREKDR